MYTGLQGKFGECKINRNSLANCIATETNYSFWTGKAIPVKQTSSVYSSSTYSLSFQRESIPYYEQFLNTEDVTTENFFCVESGPNDGNIDILL